jgi:glutamine synthetase
MFEDFQDVRLYIEERAIRMVDLKFVDLWGGWHHVTVPASQFDEAAVRGGPRLRRLLGGLPHGQLRRHGAPTGPGHGRHGPVLRGPTLGFICTILEADTKEPFPTTPATRRPGRRRTCGRPGSPIEPVGPEFEFYVFDRVTFENGINQASYRVDSEEAEWAASNGGAAT